LKAGLLRFGMNLWSPFRASGIRVRRIAVDYREIEVELSLKWHNRNYVGTHFGGSLYAMTDPFYMLMLIHILGRDYMVSHRAGAIEYLIPAKGKVLRASPLTTPASPTSRHVRRMARNTCRKCRWK
jgi:acyl-coenzyme A thioesterase PaaI-like protein